MEGTYPLPEAQLDRFLFKLTVEFPDRETLLDIFTLTTGTRDVELAHILDADRILKLRRLSREVLVARKVADHAAGLVLATHPDRPEAPAEVQRFVRFGASPRGGQAILIAAKVRALMEGRYNISFDDVRAVAKPALRHRLILNFEGEAEGKTPDDLLDAVLDAVKP